MSRPATPKDAATIVLMRNPEDPQIYWVKRADQLLYMGGFHVFPGGQRDAEDSEVNIVNVNDPETQAMIACAARETFEEVGIILADGADKIVPEELNTLRVEMGANKRTFKSILMSHGLTLNGKDFLHGGRWVTPPFAPRRFDTWFFIYWLNNEQTASIIEGELVKGEWIRPQEAYAQWQRGEVMLAPPTLHIIKTLTQSTEDISLRLMATPEANRGLVKRIEMRPGILLFPVLTPTLPPATHTNCYIVGGKEFVIIDPASPYEEEQALLADFIKELQAQGQQPREIILTHFHPDHVGGAEALRKQLNIPIAAGRLTQEKLQDKIVIDRIIEDGDIIDLPGTEDYPGWRLRALFTPGHTQDHYSFFEEHTGALISGDLIVGVGTVVIDPPEGDMDQYLASLQKVGDLPLTAIFGAHGPPIGGAKAKVSQYISHRLARETNIMKAIGEGAGTIPEIVKVVYTDVPEKMHKLAERSVLAHIEKLMREERITERESTYHLR